MHIYVIVWINFRGLFGACLRPFLLDAGTGKHKTVLASALVPKSLTTYEFFCLLCWSFSLNPTILDTLVFIWIFYHVVPNKSILMKKNWNSFTLSPSSNLTCNSERWLSYFNSLQKWDVCSFPLFCGFGFASPRQCLTLQLSLTQNSFSSYNWHFFFALICIIYIVICNHLFLFGPM